MVIDRIVSDADPGPIHGVIIRTGRLIHDKQDLSLYPPGFPMIGIERQQIIRRMLIVRQTEIPSAEFRLNEIDESQRYALGAVQCSSALPVSSR